MTPEELLQQEVEEWRKSLKHLNAKITELEEQITDDFHTHKMNDHEDYDARVRYTDGPRR